MEEVVCPPGDQAYVPPPVAVRVTDSPSQIVTEGVMPGVELVALTLKVH